MEMNDFEDDVILLDGNSDDKDDCLIVNPNENLKNNQELAEVKNTQAGSFFKDGKYLLASKLYSEAICLNPNSAVYYANRAACSMCLNELDTVNDDLEKSIQLDDSYLKAYTRKFNYLIMIGDLNKAENLLETKIKELDTSTQQFDQFKTKLNNVKYNLSLFEKSFNKKEYRQALFYIDNVISICSSNLDLRLKKAECLAFLGRHGDVLNIVQSILRKDLNNTEALFVRGLSLFYQDQLDKAHEHFKQAIVSNPDHKKSANYFKKIKNLKNLKEQGKEAVNKCDYVNAIKYYREALDIEPNNKLSNAKLCFNLSVVYGKQNKSKEALDECVKAIELDENYDKAYMKRASLYDELEMYEESIRDYELLYKKLKTKELRNCLEKAKLCAVRAKHKDYYKILGVKKTATDSEIKKAYRTAALDCHPDRHPNASDEERLEQEKKFKCLSEAYTVLSDPIKKRNYDNGADLSGQTSNFNYDRMRHWCNEDIFDQVFFNFGR